MKQDSKKTKALYLVTDKGKNGLFKVIFSRAVVITLLLLVQIFFLFSTFKWFSEYSPIINAVSLLFSSFIVIYILNSHKINSTAKTTWIMVIMAFPIFGGLLYAYTQSNLGHRILARRTNHLIVQSEHKVRQKPHVLEELTKVHEGTATLAHYLRLNGNYPVYNQTTTDYFKTGEDKYQAMMIELEKAQHFIFLEYFIIQEGEMWGHILEILARKAAEGVEVRVMYDGTNAFTKVPWDYDAKIRQLGIQCKMFAPITPFVSTHYNYRDHRKILVIDGHTAFTGGINLADEYINLTQRFGHWKDTAIMLKGDAVKTFTLMFLQLWNIDEKKPHYSAYLNEANPLPNKQTGFVIPYGDEPFDNEKVGENVYIDILNRANQYVHIMTPYLILDGELENAIKFAAKRGVEVKLILPGIPDKRIPFALAKTYYASLMDAGVDIYEYTPGFVHAKVFVSDDDTAVVGSINLDYRSLYHHFECGVLLYKTESIAEIEEDFQETLGMSELVLFDKLNNRPFIQKLTGWIVKIFAPLL